MIKLNSILQQGRLLSAVLVFGLLSACGGSDVGDQPDAEPFATAEVFGSSSATSGQIEVRSGKLVLLSGANSEGVDDPLLTFSWEQVDDSGMPVEFYERTTNSIAFTAPSVPLTQREGVDLRFRLTVTDADSRQATDEVVVRVLPAYDTNRFLLNPRVDESAQIVVHPASGEIAGADVPFNLRIDTVARWTDRQGREQTMVLKTERRNGTVAAGSGDIADAEGQTRLRLPLPLLNADEINANFRGDARPARLEFEDVEAASLSLDMVLTAQGSTPLTLQLAGVDGDGLRIFTEGDANTRSIEVEWLRQQLGVESLRSGQNYYTCIDPEGNADTLDKWIEQAGFNEYPETVVRTSYVNNYDLNFGRDMFMRKDENGNIYSYVTNYPNLENIFSGRNEFAVVVMEFSPAPTGRCGDGTFADNDGGEKIVKFYSYVPDETTGEYVRAPSMNFDGRGERMVPGVCVACHFGNTNSDQFNAANLGDIDASAANLDSSFMTWDLDAFLYTTSEETGAIDPVYSAAEISAEITAQFSREAQGDAFRAQNQMVLDTFTYDPAQLRRYEAPIKLLHGWYGNGDNVESLNFGTEEMPLTETEALALKAQVSTLPDLPFEGDYVQPGWEGQEALYHNVFARNCRLCHAQIGNSAINFDSYEEFITNPNLVNYVYELGVMPLSRLTMDRFWVEFYGETSGAEQLREHLNSDGNPDNDVGVDVVPGYPVARVSPDAIDVLTLDFDQTLHFDGGNSLFSESFEWRVDGEFVSDDMQFALRPEGPGREVEVSLLTSSLSQGLVSSAVMRTVQINNNVPSAAGLPSPTVDEGGNVDIDVFAALCPDASPDSSDCRGVFGDIRSGEVPGISLGDTSVNGEVSLVNADMGQIRFTSTEASFLGDGEFQIALTDSFGETSAFADVTVTVNGLDGPTVVDPDECSGVPVRRFASASSGFFAFGGAGCPDPSANDSAAEGLNLSIVAVDNLATDGSEVSVDGAGVIRYRPAKFFLGQDSFRYTVQDDSLAQRESSGTVRVNIEPEQRYSSLTASNGFIRSTDGDGCGSCHDGEGLIGPNWLSYDNFSAVALTRNGGGAIALDQDTTTADLLSARVFQYVCDPAFGHTGGNRLCSSSGAPGAASDLNDSGLAILRWIEEGATNN